MTLCSVLVPLFKFLSENNCKMSYNKVNKERNKYIV